MGLRVWSVDFFAYRYAVETGLRGEDVYTRWVTGPGLDERGLPYNYTPFALLALLPTALGPWWFAYGLWSIGTTAAIGAAIAVVVPRILDVWWRLPLTLLALLPTQILAHHLMFGQVNAFLTLACLVDVWLMARVWRESRDPAVEGTVEDGTQGTAAGGTQGAPRRRYPGGVLIGIATAIKLTPGLFIIFLLLLGRWREARNASLACAACFLAGFVLFPRSSIVFATTTFWELSSRVDLNNVFATSVNKSVQGVFASISPDLATVGKAVMVLLVGACLWAAVRLARRGEAVLGALAVGVGTTLASPLTWVHHWTYLLPLLVVVAVRGGVGSRIVCAVAYLGVVLAAADFEGPLLDLAVGPVSQALLGPVGLVLRAWVLVAGLVLTALLLRLPGRRES
ncbi:glycosyltransferase family 87 protein [Falsarthrobacter nasiphocae]|uniref:DUF2029 domain-containing protein n=1 Tax=Falsarthrobacter nasiphocae TaxID=189863 RepID=A0AAE3YGK7_9MICC|nr:glycosyltransferase family 87 protein [Falsarthrobacter nasiphocae]MDR6891784.1 hypothetical protein [Falsarthrobacter nasiphocae]